MSKDIYNIQDSREKLLSAVKKVCVPVIETLTPMGSNTIFEHNKLSHQVTNDGVTIISQMRLADPFEDVISQIIRQGAKRTNDFAGDGTTTTILLAYQGIIEGMKLRDAGWKPMVLKRELDKVSSIISSRIEEQKMEVEKDEDLKFVAMVSSNHDEELTKNTIEAVKVAGEDGMIMIEPNISPETELLKEEGFIMEKSGMYHNELSNVQGRMMARYDEVKVLITDKRIYTQDEAISILRPLAESGIVNVVIVAKDFLAQARNFLISNHKNPKVNMNILLVKDNESDDSVVLEDLAYYLGCPIVTDKSGKLTNKVSLDDFGTAKRVMSFPNKTIIYGEQNIMREMRVSAIREEKEREKEDKKSLEKRISRMTNGAVTIYVGGNTKAEIMDKIYRYEDSVNATRSAMRKGYVVGGGVSLRNAYLKAVKEGDFKEMSDDLVRLAEKLCHAPVYQISKNCDAHYKSILEEMKGMKGYNAITGKVEDLLKAGIIEPLEVATMSWKNGISVAQVIISSNHIITEHDDRQKESSGSEESHD